AFKKSANYAAGRQVIEAIAAGKKAQDKLGFAKEYAQRALAMLDGSPPPAQPAPGPREQGLAWFPAAATIVLGIENRPNPGRPVRSSAAPELLKLMPAEAKKEFYKIAGSL